MPKLERIQDALLARGPDGFSIGWPFWSLSNVAPDWYYCRATSMEMEETEVMEESTMMQNNEETSSNALRYERQKF